ncbi:MAG: hypothetical protein IT435_03760 [Phycisphaerales bacterium]|nr:hypothetical protein [Phycisphaerales bacterium]
MVAYLLTWKAENKDNADRPVWPEYLAASKLTQQGTPWISSPLQGGHTGGWHIGSKGDVPDGSRVFVMKQGRVPRGIVAAGFTITPVVPRRHFMDPSVKAKAVGVRLDQILDFEEFPPLDVLAVGAEEPAFKIQLWNSPFSGQRIPDGVWDALELRWAQHVKAQWGT